MGCEGLITIRKQQTVPQPVIDQVLIVEQAD